MRDRQKLIGTFLIALKIFFKKIFILFFEILNIGWTILSQSVNI